MRRSPAAARPASSRRARRPGHIAWLPALCNAPRVYILPGARASMGACFSAPVADDGAAAGAGRSGGSCSRNVGATELLVQMQQQHWRTCYLSPYCCTALCWPRLHCLDHVRRVDWHGQPTVLPAHRWVAACSSHGRRPQQQQRRRPSRWRWWCGRCWSRRSSSRAAGAAACWRWRRQTA